MKNNIKELRSQKNLTRKDLADAVDVSRQMISYIENGDKKPNLILAMKLAEFFEVPVSKLFILEKSD